MSLPTVIPGVVTSGPTADGPASQMQYVADVNIDGVLRTGITIRRPVIEQWETIVRPIRRGHAILGIRVGGAIQWQFRELPALGPCNGTDPGGVLPAPVYTDAPLLGGPAVPAVPARPAALSPITRMLQAASVTELRAHFRAFVAIADTETLQALKRALESV